MVNMLLNQVRRGVIKKPYLILLYGVDGVGKTQFAATAPRPIFLERENGSNKYNIDRLPAIASWQEAMNCIDALIIEKHDYKTFVIDSLDWLEPLLFKKICDESNTSSIERAMGGYNKGYKRAKEMWQVLIEKMNLLRDERQMNIILICHADVVDFSDPQIQETYHRYQLKIQKESAPIFREWVDALMFANYETLAKEKEGKLKTFADGSRYLYTQRQPGYDAKNRLDLPFQIPLHWGEFVKAAESGKPEAIETTQKRIENLIEQVTNRELREKAIESLERNRNDINYLLSIEKRLNQLLEGE